MTTSDHGVQFLSARNYYDQLGTSSTLKWVSANNGQVPTNAVIGATRQPSNGSNIANNNIYICRARHDAEWIPGQLRPTEKSCYITLLGLVKSYNYYEVLQNVENGSRLLWTDWDAYQTYPLGIIAGGNNLYIARKKLGDSDDNDVSSQMGGAVKNNHGFSHYVGKFNSKDAFGRVTVLTEDKVEESFVKGQLLTELEPVRYELNNVKYTLLRRRIEKEKRRLSFTTLKNNENVPLKADSALAFDSPYSSYWGQGSAMLKGLTTTIRNATTGHIVAEIEWGIEDKEERKDIRRVELLLQPGAAVNVTLWGNETTSELSYAGTLISFYKDGTTTTRKIEGVRRLHEMLEVTPEFGPAYFLKNNSLIPTTTTTTTTTSTMSPVEVASVTHNSRVFVNDLSDIDGTQINNKSVHSENEPGDLFTNDRDSIRDNKMAGSLQILNERNATPQSNSSQLVLVVAFLYLILSN
ncbi:hypothetical protein RUM44_007526 [Polyplax serrata]|uniref:Uncharacterized protein n=1 Tax=Polyplax serrata TaxID=468196 RepID=A0ABR1B0X7_POLSC